MEFKVGDKKIIDSKRYGLFGKNVMVVTLDAFGKKSLVLKHNDRLRAFILYLIDEIQKELKKVNKVTECDSYKILDNYLNLMMIQIDLLSGEESKEWSNEIVRFINKMVAKAKPKKGSKEAEAEALKEAGIIEDNMIIKKSL